MRPCWFADCSRHVSQNVMGLEAPAGYIHTQRALWAHHGSKCAHKRKKKLDISLVELVGAWDEVPHPAVGKGIAQHEPIAAQGLWEERRDL